MRKLSLLSLLSVIILAACTSNQDRINQVQSSEAAINKKVVLDFYQRMFGDKDISAVDEYILPNYIQHNPAVADGAQAFKDAAAVWFKGAAKEKIDVQRIAAEADLVFIHLKNKAPDGGLISTIDIFRLENGKIAEHWDVHQEVPAESANAHPMF